MSEQDKKPVKLVRMPDGSIRPQTDVDSDIGAVWATQQQIREAEAKEQLMLKQNPGLKPKRRLFKKRPKKNSIAKSVAPPTTVKSPQSQATYRNQSAADPPSLPPKSKPVPPATKEIAISLTLPEVKLPQKHAKKASKKLKNTPKWAYAVAALVLVPAFLITWGAVSGKPNKKQGNVQGTEAVAIPDFQTLSPNGDITDTTSQKINYDPVKKVASFTDKINGFEVTVSMQPLPATFKPDIATNVKKVADQFLATTKLDVDNGAAYLGTSGKGPQSFVGYRGDLLVFMKSGEKIDTKAWAEYFNSLK